MAADSFAGVVSSHTDPEAYFMYAAVQAHFGDPERALARLTRAVDGGFTVPRPSAHPWLSALRCRSASTPSLAASSSAPLRRVALLVERAEERRRDAAASATARCDAVAV